MEFEPLDQFIVQPMDKGSGMAALIWLEASVIIVQLSVISFVLMAYPIFRMLPRVGLSKWWALLAVFPPAALILIWIIGVRPWVTED